MYVCGAYTFVYTRMWGRQTEQERGKEKRNENTGEKHEEER